VLELTSYLLDRFVPGGEAQATLVNPATEEPIARIAGPPLQAAPVLAHARAAGSSALGEMTFAQRGDMLRALAKVIHAHRDELIPLAIANGGNTRGDAKFDIDGASGTLAFYADLGQSLGARRLLVDGDGVQLGRSPRLFGQHVYVPRAGAAVLVNAFNFPAWGIAEKAACALLAGMPVVAKPASATALLAHRMVELWTEAKILPPGALQLVLGGAGDFLDHLSGHDVLAFTGSSATGALLRGHPRVVADNVRVNVEADSLNAAVLGPDAVPGSATYDLFLADVVRDMTQKTGQKCTAIRRVMVPPEALARALDDLTERLAAVRVGDPAATETMMGPVATAGQLVDVRAGITRLGAEARTVYAGPAPEGRGFFVGPVLFEAQTDARAVHAHEVFGPVATVIPYDGSARSAAIEVRKGGGGLVASIYSDDRVFLADLVPAIASHHGRLFIGSAKIADKSPGPGTVLPQLVHGGPARAGGGEELGALRGMALYLQRTALQGDKALLDSIAPR